MSRDPTTVLLERIRDLESEIRDLHEVASRSWTMPFRCSVIVQPALVLTRDGALLNRLQRSVPDGVEVSMCDSMDAYQWEWRP